MKFVYAANIITTKTSVVETSAAQLFNLAIEHFNAKRYRKAIELFLSAEQSGLNLAKLHFNLGSAYYKTQQYQAALASFTTASTDSQLNVLARINMALCLIKLSQPEQATQQLQMASSLSQNIKYQHLIKRIANKHNLVLSGNDQAAYWHGTYSLFYGLNDNVILLEDLTLDSTSKEDNFLQTSLSTAIQTDGLFNFQFKLLTINFNHLKEFNYLQINLEPELRVDYGDWRYKLISVYQPSNYGEHRYLTTIALQNELRYRYSRKLHIGGSINAYRYSHRRDEFSHLSGRASRQGLFAAYQSKRLTINLSAHNQLENRMDYYNASDSVPRRSFSPQRQELQLQSSIKLGKLSRLSLSAQHRRSDFSNQGENRIDKRQSINVNFGHKIDNKYWFFLVAYRVKNDSDNDIPSIEYNYKSNSYMLGFSGEY